MAAQHGVHFLKSLSPSTHAIFLTLTHTHKHTHRPLPCLLTLIPLHLFVFLTSCQKRPSESSGRDQRPDLVIGQDGEETDDCVFTTAWVHLPICVCLTHTCYSHAYSEYEYVHHGLCLNQVFFLGLPHTGTCIHIHTLLHSSSLWRRTGSSDRFLISADPKMPWSWYAETCPHPPIWSTHWPEKGVTHMRKRMGSLFWGFIKWMGFFFCC